MTGFVLGVPQIDVVLCGVNDGAQLEDICARANALPPAQFAELAVADPALLNPSRWSVNR